MDEWAWELVHVCMVHLKEVGAWLCIVSYRCLYQLVARCIEWLSEQCGEWRVAVCCCISVLLWSVSCAAYVWLAGR